MFQGKTEIYVESEDLKVLKYSVRQQFKYFESIAIKLLSVELKL